MAASTTSTTAFTEMAEQLQKTVVSPRQRQQAATVAQLDPQKYVATMQQLMQNPQFRADAGPCRVHHAGGLTNPTHKEQLEARVVRMKERTPRSSPSSTTSSPAARHHDEVSCRCGRWWPIRRGRRREACRRGGRRQGGRRAR
uniref:Uncharacterized protein n=1 Tax=Saccharum officinarum TaxID=4547 RepID=A0A678TL54_SACOF|nr:hypothetical protein SO96G07_000004 [Saccharum officinarum]